jgi:hypothetical protein
VALWGRKLEDPSRLFLQRYETRSLYGASSRGIPVKYTHASAMRIDANEGRS